MIERLPKQAQAHQSSRPRTLRDRPDRCKLCLTCRTACGIRHHHTWSNPCLCLQVRTRHQISAWKMSTYTGNIRTSKTNSRAGPPVATMRGKALHVLRVVRGLLGGATLLATVSCIWYHDMDHQSDSVSIRANTYWGQTPCLRLSRMQQAIHPEIRPNGTRSCSHG